MKLTATKVKAIRSDPKGARKHYDGAGLHLNVTAKGAKHWRMDYRFGGKPKTLSIGSYPAVGLADARSARDAAKEQLAKGLDPTSERRRVKAEVVQRGDNDLWQVVAQEWRDKREQEGADPTTLKTHDWLIRRLSPALGKRRLGEITAPQLLEALREVESEGRHYAAGRMRSLAGRVFRYGIATGRCERDVAADLKDALVSSQVTHRAAVFHPDEVGALMRGIRAYGGEPMTRWALLLCAYSGLRPGEVRGLCWSEIDWDRGQIVIPGRRMKVKSRKHVVPMSPQIREVLQEAKQQTGHCKLVLSANSAGDKMQSDMTYNKALRSILPSVGLAPDQHVAHGFRRTFSTTLHEAGWPSDWIEAQLAHKLGGVRGVYNAAQYLPGRQEMLSWYAHWLDTARMGCPVDPPNWLTDRIGA